MDKTETVISVGIALFLMMGFIGIPTQSGLYFGFFWKLALLWAS